MATRGSTLTAGEQSISTPGVAISAASGRRSLNREARRRELIKITKEN